MKWKHLDDPMLDTNREPLEPDDQAAVDDVLDAAQAFADGQLPFYEAAGFGTLTDWRGNISPAYSRYVAITRTPKNDPRTKALRLLLDTLVEKEGYVITRQGVFRPEEIRANEAGWQYANFEAA